MTASIINGKEIAIQIQGVIQSEVNQLLHQGYRAPCLATILVGEDPASQVYVQKKLLACQQVGIKSIAYNLEKSISETDLLDKIADLNNNPEIDGILVQLPLPAQIADEIIIEAIHPLKDVDGFHPYNLGRLLQGRPLLRPCTPYGIMTMLDTLKLKTIGQHAVIVGASNIVGRPMAFELLRAKATVTICHAHTQDVSSLIKHADILVSAIGKPNVIHTDWIKPGAIVIDVGITRHPNGHLVGDIDFKTAKERAGWITPVPGGVGPMTVAMLLENTLLAHHLQHPEQKASL